MRFSFLFDTFRLRFFTLYTIQGGKRKSFRHCSHRKCHLKDNKVASVDRLWPASPFKVKLKFKLLFKCLRQLTMSAIYPKTDIIITHSKPTQRQTHSDVGNTRHCTQYEATWRGRRNCSQVLAGHVLGPVPVGAHLQCLLPPQLAMVYGRLWAGRVSIYVGHSTLAEKCVGMSSLTPSGYHPPSHI